jgi:hypothetical protein
MPSQTSKKRSTSLTVARKPACAPLLAMYREAERTRPQSWPQVEEAFLRAMEEFDANVVSGLADQGDRQNGKGDFFNDLVALLLENRAEVELYSRRGLTGFVFPQHNLDVTYPNTTTGIAKFALEVKAVGTPRHPKSPKQSPIGRPGAADLPKRIKEASFKVIDLKAEYGRAYAAQGQVAAAPAGDLTSWLHSVPPTSYLFISARVVSHLDYQATVDLARAAGQVMDAVGLFCFEPVTPEHPTRYRPCAVPREIGMDQILHRASQRLRSLRDQPVEDLELATSDAAKAQQLISQLGVDIGSDEGS